MLSLDQTLTKTIDAQLLKESYRYSRQCLIQAADQFEHFFEITNSFPGWKAVTSRDYSSFLSTMNRETTDQNLRKLTSVLDELGVLLQDAQVLRSNPFDLASIYALYLSGERQLAQSTVIGYENDLKMIRVFLKDKKQWQGWINIRPQDIQAYLTYLNDQRRHWTTINRELASLRTFYNFLLMNGLVDVNPFEDIKLKTRPRSLPRYFYEPELNILFKAADGRGRPLDFRNRAILELLYATGMRVSECSSLQLNQLDWDTQVILVRGKGDKERYVPFGNFAARALKKYLNQCRTPLMRKYNRTHSTVFINHYGQPITSEGIEYVLNQIVKRSSLNTKIHPHMLRHSFATAMLNNGADIRSVQELLGHASLSTTQIYTHVTRDNLQNTYMKMFPRAKLKRNDDNDNNR